MLESGEMEQLYRSQETRKFYKKSNASHRGFVPLWDKDGGILMDEREMIQKWKQHYDKLLNSAEVEHQDSRRNGYIGTAEEDDVLTPTISDVEDAIKQLKNKEEAWLSERY